MEAEIYGITPNANTEARENEPPANIFNKPKIPSCVFVPISVGSIPGNTIKEPTR